MDADKTDGYDPKTARKMLAYFKAPPVRFKYKREYNRDGSLKAKTPVEVAPVFPTFEGFAAKIGAAPGDLRRWEEEDPDFAAACARAREMQQAFLLAAGLAGRFGSAFAAALAKGLLRKGGALPPEDGGGGENGAAPPAEETLSEPEIWERLDALRPQYVLRGEDLPAKPAREGGGAGG